MMINCPATSNLLQDKVWLSVSYWRTNIFFALKSLPATSIRFLTLKVFLLDLWLFSDHISILYCNRMFNKELQKENKSQFWSGVSYLWYDCCAGESPVNWGKKAEPSSGDSGLFFLFLLVTVRQLQLQHLRCSPPTTHFFLNNFPVYFSIHVV